MLIILHLQTMRIKKFKISTKISPKSLNELCRPVRNDFHWPQPPRRVPTSRFVSRDQWEYFGTGTGAIETRDGSDWSVTPNSRIPLMGNQECGRGAHSTDTEEVRFGTVAWFDPGKRTSVVFRFVVS